MHIGELAVEERASTDTACRSSGRGIGASAKPFSADALGIQPHQSLGRILRLLHNVNIRISLFVFDTLPGTLGRMSLRQAVQFAVDDCGFAFELEDGRIAALVYGWRPPRADDAWVEARTLERLGWALGGSASAASLVDTRAIHRSSTEIACPAEVPSLLTLALPVCGGKAAGTA